MEIQVKSKFIVPRGQAGVHLPPLFWDTPGLDARLTTLLRAIPTKKQPSNTRSYVGGERFI